MGNLVSVNIDVKSSSQQTPVIVKYHRYSCSYEGST